MAKIINLISLNPKTVLKFVTLEQYRGYCGLLTSPRNGKNIASSIAHGVLWAADNDCFTGFNEQAFVNALERWQQYANHCLFINAPDVLLDANATLKQFERWQPIIKGFGYPVAYTIQNGQSMSTIPWNSLDALFIGSSNVFKYSRDVALIIKEAKNRNKWVHNGRTNTHNSIQYFLRYGANSFDGSGYSKEPPRIRKHLYYQQHIIPTLFDWSKI